MKLIVCTRRRKIKIRASTRYLPETPAKEKPNDVTRSCGLHLGEPTQSIMDMSENKTKITKITERKKREHVKANAQQRDSQKLRISETLDIADHQDQQHQQKHAQQRKQPLVRRTTLGTPLLFSLLSPQLWYFSPWAVSSESRLCMRTPLPPGRSPRGDPPLSSSKS